MGGKDKGCKVSAEKENIWLCKVTQESESSSRSNLGFLGYAREKSRTLSLFFWKVGRSIEEKGREGFFFPTL